ncbi:VCBS repeat-containing protein [Asanoa sp. WMMD1127]|uniref:FG-GAP repeat domain-containing protein n=1 Tax=Asanoa sp. WMMD1127 TaxID=3016107 RepID=UPI0024167DA5|nr:VCBS repeat-containing protein [Asanoa sp. WMMD1127]MDG4825043.1 VCBS repeat-containing protein [Asanoa sp. WMMD1127]
MPRQSHSATRMVIAAVAAIVMVGTHQAAAAAATGSPGPAEPPMPADAALYIDYDQCVTGGATAADDAIADQVRPQMNGPRLGKAVNAYNVSCARIITETARGRGLAKRAAVIAVTTAIAESTLHNYTQAVDHDSLGLFQQRPSMGWGTPSQLTDPVYATNAFLNAMVRKYPNNSWMSGDIGQICQKVQVSAYPDAYAKEAHDAQLLVDQLWDKPVPKPSTDSSRLRADFTGDGLDDVGLFYDYGGGRVALWVLRGVAGGALAAPVRWWEDVDWGSNTRYVSAGDFNGDGKADIALFYQYPTPGQVALWTLTSLGDRFDAPTNRWSDSDWGSNTSFMTIGDYNGDRKSDIGLLYDYPGSRAAFWTLTADGSDADGKGLSLPSMRWDDSDFGSNTRFAGSGDFNGDGRSDLALFYDYGDRHVAMWTLTSTGGGFSTPVRRWDGPSWGGGTQFMTVGTFVNGDDKADIALFYDYGGGHVRLFTLAADATGTGQFGAPVGRWDDVDFGSGTAYLTATQLSSTTHDDIQLFYQYDGARAAIWSINPGGGAYNTVTRRWYDTDWGTRTFTML